MNVGDYVRFIHGVEEGHVIRIVDEHNVEVETSDGFTIPALKKDLVVVSNQEHDLFQPESAENDSPSRHYSKSDKQRTGIFIGEIKESEQKQIYLINNTSNDILFSILKKTGTLNFTGMVKGEVEKENFKFIGKFQPRLAQVPSDIYVQIIYYSHSESALPKPITAHLQLRKLLNESKDDEIPLIHTKGKVIDILSEISNEQEPRNDSNEISIAEKVVDLHADAFLEDPEYLSSEEIVEKQLERFRKFTDRAIISGLPEITFIHGIGDGILKDLIIKESKGYPQIRYHKAADQGRFGKGATIFKISR